MNRHCDDSFREMSATREDTISDTEDQENYLYALNDVPGNLPPSLDADLIESDHPQTRNDCNFSIMIQLWLSTILEIVLKSTVCVKTDGI